MRVYRRRVVRRFRGRRAPVVRRPMRALRSALVRKRITKYNVHSFVRWTVAPEGGRSLSCNFGPSGLSFRAYTFTLNDVINPAEFTSLFDSYKITGVKVYFDYTPDVATAITSSSQYPKLWVKRDYDDGSAPVNIGEFTQSNQTSCLRFSESRTTLSMFIRPSVQNNIIGGTANMWKPWLNCGDPAVVHYGLKLAAQGLPSTNLGSITIRCKYYLKFKNVR